MTPIATTAHRLVHILDADPELGARIAPERLPHAREELVARQFAPRTTVWHDRALEFATADAMGVLVLEGVVARELALADNVTTELLGPGDIVKSSGRDPTRLLRAEVRWTMLEPTRFAVLGAQFTAALARHPEVCAALMDRLLERSHRLAVFQAISQLNGVERRIESLLWFLAERWGRVCSEGIAVPLVLPHRIVAQLVGARRPTVSMAVGRLTDEGRLRRRPDGAWLLTGDPVGIPTGEARRLIPTRRPRVPHEPAGGVRAQAG